MLGKTHVLGGMATGLGCFIAMKECGMLINGIDEYLQIGIILPYSVWASTVPDRDQDKDSTAEANPLNLILQKFFKLCKVPHRGAISHLYPSLISMLLVVLLWTKAYHSGTISASTAIGMLILIGLTSGLVSHTVLDCFTMQGICGGKIRFVPNREEFGVGTLYEKVWQRCLYVFICLLIIGCISMHFM